MGHLSLIHEWVCCCCCFKICLRIGGGGRERGREKLKETLSWVEPGSGPNPKPLRSDLRQNQESNALTDCATHDCIKHWKIALYFTALVLKACSLGPNSRAPPHAHWIRRSPEPSRGLWCTEKFQKHQSQTQGWWEAAFKKCNPHLAESCR